MLPTNSLPFFARTFSERGIFVKFRTINFERKKKTKKKREKRSTTNLNGKEDHRARQLDTTQQMLNLSPPPPVLPKKRMKTKREERKRNEKSGGIPRKVRSSITFRRWETVWRAVTFPFRERACSSGTRFLFTVTRCTSNARKSYLKLDGGEIRAESSPLEQPRHFSPSLSLFHCPLLSSSLARPRAVWCVWHRERKRTRNETHARGGRRSESGEEPATTLASSEFRLHVQVQQTFTVRISHATHCYALDRFRTVLTLKTCAREAFAARTEATFKR